MGGQAAVRQELVSYVCIDCNRWVKAPPWTDWAKAQRCRRHYLSKTAALARAAEQAAAQRDTGQDQLTLPDW